MASDWEPANDVEARLLAAADAGDENAFIEALSGAELFLPITPQASAGVEPVTWATIVLEDRTYLIAFTSPDAMIRSTGGAAQHCRATPYRALAAAWPDPGWHLLLDPALPLESRVAPGDVVRFATEALVDVLASRSSAQALPATVMQKILSLDQMVQYLQATDHWIGGYVHRFDDVLHLDTPAKLVEGLRLVEPMSVTEELVFALRWPVVGAELYRSSYGGVDADAMRAMDGWFVEEQRFTGTGFVPLTVPPIQEYKVESARLPHQAEIFRIDREGEELLVAIYDADRRHWMLVDHEAATP